MIQMTSWTFKPLIDEKGDRQTDDRQTTTLPILRDDSSSKNVCAVFYGPDSRSFNAKDIG